MLNGISFPVLSHHFVLFRLRVKRNNFHLLRMKRTTNTLYLLRITEKRNRPST